MSPEELADLEEKIKAMRGMTPAEKAMAAIRLVTSKHGGQVVGEEKITVSDISRLTGIGPRSLHRARYVVEHASEDLLTAVESGEVPLKLAEDALRGRRITAASQRTALYRHFDRDGRLLYVGITHDVHDRTKTHCRTSEWVELADHFTGEWFDTRWEAKRAETKAIKEEHPLFNIAERVQ